VVAEIIGPKFEEKWDICIVLKYLSQGTYYKGNSSNFIRKKPVRHHPNQVIKINYQ
jgi:hypothetical protein